MSRRSATEKCENLVDFFIQICLYQTSQFPNQLPPFPAPEHLHISEAEWRNVGKSILDI